MGSSNFGEHLPAHCEVSGTSGVRQLLAGSLGGSSGAAFCCQVTKTACVYCVRQAPMIRLGVHITFRSL